VNERKSVREWVSGSVRLRAPFPWFGGKSRAAHLVWPRFGNVPNYVEPFFGSGAVLLARPHQARAETINDADCYVANFWRALQADRTALARAVDWPVNEADLHARHLWLVNQSGFREMMKTEPDFYDIKIAAWWCWGICQWIGAGWCYHRDHNGGGRQAPADKPWRKHPCLRRGGKGVHGYGLDVHQKRPNLTSGGANGIGVVKRQLWQTRPAMVANGVHRQLPDISGDSGAFGRGVHRSALASIDEWFSALSERFRRVRVVCGDFERVLGPSPTYKIGTTGVFLDPPYSGDRDTELYRTDCMQVAHRARAWALQNGDNPKLRIALCGLEGEHDMPADWECVAWKANGGYGNRSFGRGRANAHKERIWFSPHCLKA
jgi:site-specific DNA-adenine methylase